MFTAARRFASNTWTGVSNTNDFNGSNVNLLAGCYLRKFMRTTSSSGGGLKALVTTGLLFILVALYCLYSANNSTSRIVTTVTLGHQSLDNINAASVQSAVFAKMDGENSGSNLGNDNSDINKKKQWKKQLKFKPISGGVVTVADMYEPGFRIRNAGLCSSRTRLLVLITSAALPVHSQNRQAIRMTWMNRYGPVVSMAFLVGTPKMSETDSVAQELETEEMALKIRLGKKDIDVNKKSKEPPKPSSSVASVADDSLDAKVGGDYRYDQPSKNQESNPDEGLDEHAMNGLNRAEQTVQRVLGHEHSRYGDIVQCRSRDSYTNLTLKSIAALEWTREYCPQAQYLLKTDDDMFIDVHRLLKFINKVEIEANPFAISSTPMDTKNNVFEDPNISDLNFELPPTIWGRVAHGWRPIRKLNSKYFVSRSQYSGRVFPDFCTGPAYLMTRSTVHPLYEGALGKDFDVIDDEDEDYASENDLKNLIVEESNIHLDKTNSVHNQTLMKIKIRESVRNTEPYLKLEDVYLTGVVAERLTRRAIEREEHKKKGKMSSIKGDTDTNKINNKTVTNEQTSGSKKNKSKTANIIVKIRRIHNDQFANKKITGLALERAVCNGVNSGNIVGNGGFSWFHWYWGDISVDKDKKKKKKDPGVISIHMVKYFEQFDLWRRLMDGRTKCKT